MGTHVTLEEISRKSTMTLLEREEGMGRRIQGINGKIMMVQVLGMDSNVSFWKDIQRFWKEKDFCKLQLEKIRRVRGRGRENPHPLLSNRRKERTPIVSKNLITNHAAPRQARMGSLLQRLGSTDFGNL